MKNQAYNVGLSQANLSKRELTERIKVYVPDFYVHTSEIGSDPDKRNYIISNEKIETVGFRPEHTIDQGIQQLIKAFRMMPRQPSKNY